jgi:hypothetical protein
MSGQQREVINLLRSAGATLARQKRHQVFRFRDGRIWVLPSTPGDCRAWANNLSGLRRRLGLRTAARA